MPSIYGCNPVLVELRKEMMPYGNASLSQSVLFFPDLVAFEARPWTPISLIYHHHLPVIPHGAAQSSRPTDRSYVISSLMLIWGLFA